MGAVGFLLNLSFPAEAHHVVALRDVVAQAVKQAGGDDERANAFAEQVAAMVNESAGQQAGGGTVTVAVELGPPLQVICAGRRLAYLNPAEAGPHESS